VVVGVGRFLTPLDGRKYQQKYQQEFAANVDGADARKGTTMATRKRKRARRHPGVTLMKPDATARTGWRARYTDPDTGKLKKETLPANLTTSEQRDGWAADKSTEIRKRAVELGAGAVRATGTAFGTAIENFYRHHPAHRAATVTAYRDVTDRLVAWASRHGVKTADDLTVQKLTDFGATLKQGGRSGHTINRQLVRVKTVLQHLIEQELLPKLSEHRLRVALKPVEAPSIQIEFMEPADLRTLLEAAARHDADCHDLTREDKRAGRKPGEGTTPKHDPIAPLVAVLCLSGLRLNEAISLQWSAVKLDALDEQGREAGELQIDGLNVKTWKGRTVYLEVSPMLRQLLAAMKLRTGGKGSVFRMTAPITRESVPMTEDYAHAAMKRLRGTYGAPEGSGYQMMRRCCGTYLSNAPSIYGSAAATKSARQLGHGIVVASTNYVGALRYVPKEAKTLEAAMQIEAQVAAVIDAVTGKTSQAKSPAPRKRAKLIAVK